MNASQRRNLAEVVVWTIIGLVCIAAVCALLPSCSLLATVGGASAGAAVGGAVGGPGGAIAGGGIGAGAGKLWGENEELKSGDIVGAGALERTGPSVALPGMPTSEKLAWGALGFIVLWLLRKPLWRVLKGAYRAPGRLLRPKTNPLP